MFVVVRVVEAAAVRVRKVEAAPVRVSTHRNERKTFEF